MTGVVIVFVCVAILWIATGINAAMTVRLRRVTARLDEARKTFEADAVMLPIMEVDAGGHLVGLSFDLGTIEAGASKTFAVPIIKGLGQKVLAVTSSNGIEMRLLFDFETGKVEPAADDAPATPIPDAFNEWRDAESP